VDFLPDVPALAEAGRSGFESVGGFRPVAPAGTPQDIIAKLNAARRGINAE
jgi:tripartite-type tricarboxylate transporter receptor subunit TctC